MRPQGIVSTFASLSILFVMSTAAPSVLEACIGEDGRLPPPEVTTVISQPPEGFYRLPSARVTDETMPRRSEEPLLIILFKFNDTGTSFGQTSFYQWMMLGFHSALSLQDYFDEVSYGWLTLTKATESHGTANDGVVGWYTSSQNWSDYLYYGGAVNYPKIFGDALTAADANVNFASFDTNGDGALSTSELHIVVIPAVREGSYKNAASPKVWRSNWCLSNAVYDGVTVAGAADFGSICIAGEVDPSGNRIPFGLVAHEIGHQLGWPDLYDTDRDCYNGYVKNAGLGEWDLMSGGDWNGWPAGLRPAHPCGWLKAYRTWLTPTQVTEDVTGVTIDNLAQNPTCYKLWTSGNYGGNYTEYFVVENRQKIGTTYDSSIPGSGLLIYHVDEGVMTLDYQGTGRNNWSDNTLQWDYAREFIDLECADGYTRNNNGSQCSLPCEQCAKDDLDVEVNASDSGSDCDFDVTYSNRGDGGNPFPGSTSNTDFDSDTCPSSESNAGNDTFVGVKNIAASENNITADFDVAVPVPPWPDVWVMDCPEDTGEEPSRDECRSWWTSPSIWVDNDNDGLQDRPVVDAVNRFWVRIKNRGDSPATNVTVKLYRRTNALGLSFPNGADSVNARLIGLVPAAAPVKTFMDAYIPPNPTDNSHYCFGVTLDCEVDPLDVDAGMIQENNKACVNIVQLYRRVGQPGGPREPVYSAFLVDSPDDDSNPGPGTYRVEMDSDLPEGLNLHLEWMPTENDPWLTYAGEWQGGRFLGDPFNLSGVPGESIPFRIAFDEPSDPHGEIGGVDVQQVFLSGGRLIQSEPLYPDKAPPLDVGEERREPVEPPRTGGDTIEDAVEIPGCESFWDFGSTCAFNDNYSEACPWGGGSAPDVVYSFYPMGNRYVTIDLCSSWFDTKIYVYKDGYTPGQPYACNDDAGCGPSGFASKIENILFEEGHPYYIVVDGYGSGCGDYEISLSCTDAGPALGGMRYPAYLDKYPPEAIDDLATLVVNTEAGEEPMIPAVLLTWSPTVQDTAGNIEWVDRYWVYRSRESGFDPDTCSVFFSTTIDPDTTSSGWQFTDGFRPDDPGFLPGITYYYKVITQDRAGWLSAPSNEASATPLPWYDSADHDVGNCVLTVTDQGIVGFMNSAQETGSGFVYPVGGENLLFVGSLWVGADTSYVANRDYDDDPEREWIVADEPDGHIWIDTNGRSDQDIFSGYTDGEDPGSLDLRVMQESWAFSTPADLADLVIVRYRIENQSESALNDLYAGVFLDLDIGDYTQNTGIADAEQKLAYMTDGSGVYAGLAFLEPLTDALPLSNVSLIDNVAFVYDQAYILDPDKFGFLAASDSAHVLSATPSAGDYGVVVSVGPFSLAANEVREVAVAIIGSADPDEIATKALAAEAFYRGGIQGLEDGGDGLPLRSRLLPCQPNPTRGATVILYDLAREGRVSIDLYDIGGRRITSLASGRVAAGRHSIQWDGKDASGHPVAGGVYFLRYRTDAMTETRRVILVR